MHLAQVNGTSAMLACWQRNIIGQACAEQLCDNHKPFGDLLVYKSFTSYITQQLYLTYKRIVSAVHVESTALVFDGARRACYAASRAVLHWRFAQLA